MPKYFVRVQGAIEIAGIVEADTADEAEVKASDLTFATVTELSGLSELTVETADELPDDHENDRTPATAKAEPFRRTKH